MRSLSFFSGIDSGADLSDFIPTAYCIRGRTWLLFPSLSLCFLNILAYRIQVAEYAARPTEILRRSHSCAVSSGRELNSTI